jgi:hypothetical protein
MGSPRLFLQRCVLHPRREAAARCPGCRRFFCRECVVEHEGRLLCASCVADVAAQAGRGRRRWVLRGLMGWTGLVVALLLTWLCFYLLGRALLVLPSDLHETTRLLEER